MYNYKMTLEYDGGRYDGWQRMGGDGTDNTIAAKITEVLKKMTGEEIELFCGMRTEKGVHAYAQTANFKLSAKQKPIEIQNYLNRYLPRDIAVLELSEAEERFHSQLNAKTRTYCYRIDAKKVADVFERKYMYHTFHKLDVAMMQKAAESFIGEFDYKVFSTVKKSKSTTKRVDQVNIYDDGDSIEITITASDFLHNMARMMVGTLLDIGDGKRPAEDVAKLLSGDSSVAVSAPAECQGLFLQSIQY